MNQSYLWNMETYKEFSAAVSSEPSANLAADQLERYS